MRSKLVLLLAGIMLVTSIFGGCTAKEPAAAETPEAPEAAEAPKAVETVKIGAILPLTGGAAATGVKLQAAMEVAQEIINGEHPEIAIPLAKEAGLPNLGNAKLEIVFADHQGNPEMAKSEAERLIEEGVAGLVGSYQSSATKPASQAAEQYGVPFVAGSSSSAALTERGLQYFVRIAPNDDMETAMFFDYLIYLNENFNGGIKKIAVAYIDNEFGVHAKDMVEKWIKEKYGALGFELVGTVPYAVDVTNVDTEVQQIKSLNADAIFHASYIADITMFVNKYKEFKITPKAVLNYCGGFQDTQFVVNLSNDGDYFAGGAAFSAEKLDGMPELAEINKLYKAKTGADLDGPALEEFSSVMVLAEAINIAGKLDGDAIMDVIKNTAFDAPYYATGKVKFNEKGQNEVPASYVVQTQDKKYQAVYPKDTATADPIVPFPDWSQR
ncbi:MAG: ABC transporter substrate-binding protein [Clostridia bacterium]|nr:ABC transporter substrate-binding protein [Clostridia bacterium]HOM42657.1 ABC transporter substrate-binding protein [Bacillota bacterium]